MAHAAQINWHRINHESHQTFDSALAHFNLAMVFIGSPFLTPLL